LRRQQEIEALMESPTFWDDNLKAQAVISELKTIKTLIGDFPAFEQEAKDLLELLDMAASEKDEATGEQIKADSAKLNEKVRGYELKAQLTG
jgi:peptide chain release factor 2